MARNVANLKRGGSPGRTPGVPNKATQVIREAARTFVEDEAGQRKMLEQYRRGRLHPAIVTMLHHYAYGKPKETIDINTPMRALVVDLLLPGEGRKGDGDDQ